MTLGSIFRKLDWRGRFIRYAPLILWAAVIFVASSTAGASDNTSRIIGPLLKWLLPDALPETIAAIHGYIRKLAHFTEYAFLAFFAFRAFALSRIPFVRRYWFLWAFLTVVVIASTDEYNQSFNSLRTGSVYDVMIDCAGGATMIAVIAAYRRFREKSKSESKSESD